METEIKPTREQLDKWERLREYFEACDSVAVAYSGGVDSALLLQAAHDVLGERAVAITAVTCFFPKREEEEALCFCEQRGIEQIKVVLNPLSVEGIADNPENRCYLCKREIFTQIKREAQKRGLSHVVEGSNVDDGKDYRPGMRAIAELAVDSPLRECGLYKRDIRSLSNYLGLPTWKKPSYACLASRFPYREQISEEKLQMVEQAEQLLYDMGFTQFRVRIHGQMARIEILPEQFGKLMEETTRQTVSGALRQYGFQYVAMDLQGYRTGSMNEILPEHGNAKDC